MSLDLIAEVYLSNTPNKKCPSNLKNDLNLIRHLLSPDKRERPKSVNTIKKKNQVPDRNFSISRTKITEKAWPNKRITEVEKENKSLKLSLEKTKTLLDSAIRNLSNSDTSEKIVEKYLQQGLYISYLEKQLEKYKTIEETSHEMSKHRLLISKLSEKIKTLETENRDLKEQVIKYQRGARYTPKAYHKFDVSLIVSKIFKSCCRFKLEIDELGYIINPNGLESLSISQIQIGFKALNLVESRENIKHLLQVIVGYDVEEVSQDTLIRGIKYLGLSEIKFSDIKQELNIISLAFAAIEITKTILIGKVKGIVGTLIDFSERLINEGLLVDQKTVEKVLIALFDKNEQRKFEDFIEDFFRVVEDIKISDEEIEILDNEIKKIFKEKWDMFVRKCADISDLTHSEITFKEFIGICNSLTINLSKEMIRYLQIYFYSQTGKIDIMPYLNFYIYFSKSNIKGS